MCILVETGSVTQFQKGLCPPMAGLCSSLLSSCSLGGRCYRSHCRDENVRLNCKWWVWVIQEDLKERHAGSDRLNQEGKTPPILGRREPSTERPYCSNHSKNSVGERPLATAGSSAEWKVLCHFQATHPRPSGFILLW